MSTARKPERNPNRLPAAERLAAWQEAAAKKRVQVQHERVQALAGIEPAPAPLVGQLDLFDLGPTQRPV